MPSGTVGSTGMLVAGTLTAQSIDIQYSSNAAATSADLIKVCYSSSCGFSTNKLQQLNNRVLTIPSKPVSVSKTLISDVCGARVFRYTVYPVTGADGYLWIPPSTLGGISGVTVVGIDTANSSYIDLKFRSNLYSLYSASYLEVIKVRAFNTCGSSDYGSFMLRIEAKTGCPSSTTKNIEESNVKGNSTFYVFPNPTHDIFNINMSSYNKDKVLLNIKDASGRLLSTGYIDNNRPVSRGAELKAGIYFIEAIQGEIKKTIKIVKY
jgi:hypothetical protein